MWRLRFLLPLLLLLARESNHASGFIVTPATAHSRQVGWSLNVAEAASSVEEDCGCAVTEFSGEPSSRAQSLNARQAIQGLSVYNAAGEAVTFECLLPPRESRQPVIAVFLRSLG